MQLTTLLALWFFALFTADRLLKHLAVMVFFHRPRPPAPNPWPTLTLIQPITHSPNDLLAVVRARARLQYPNAVQQILVYDAQDAASLACLQQVQREHPTWEAQFVPAQQPGTPIATKTFKMNLGLAQATGEVIGFVDDDILLPPTALTTLAQHLSQPTVGAVFGLACYTNWRTQWAALMSAFVNSNALLTYIPFTFLLQPFTITGHCYALRRTMLTALWDAADMQQRIDDDHELARRVRQQGLRLSQTPLVYGVDNALASWHSYQGQMKRWFAFPRQHMLPHLGRAEQVVTLLSSITNLIPGILLGLALVGQTPSLWLAWLGCLGVFSGIYLWQEQQFLPYRTPLTCWPYVLCSALLAPILVLWALAAGDDIEWRGQRLRLKRNGRFERL